MFHKTAGTRSSMIKSICVMVILLLILPVVLISMMAGCSGVSQTVDTSTTEVTVQAKIEPTAVSTISSAAEVSTINLSHVVPLSRSRSASALSVSPDGKLVIAVNPDNNSITLIDAINLVVLTEIPVGDTPRTLSITPDSETVLVANHGSATISKVDISLAEEVAQFPVGSMPYGVVTDGVNAFITEFGLGTVSKIDLITGKLLSRIPVDTFPSGLALSKDGQRLFITHFSTGILTVIDQETFTVYGKASTGADTNLSQFIAVAPDGTKAYLPQTRSNITNTALLFDTTVFPVVNVLDLTKLQLLVRERITLDTADEPVNMPFAVALSPDAKTLYLANAGSDDVSVIDLDSNSSLAHLSVGSNPRGLAITPDGSRIFVNNVLDGTLSVINAETLTVTNTIPVTNISLTPTVLLGKKLFNSGAEPALTTDNWISCATCHFDGTMDSRTWLGFPDGPRNTPALFGVGQTLPIHWSGDLDELQDVEITIREIQFGNGLVEGRAHDSLGSPHSGLSVELDALSAYLASIQVPPSPFGADSQAIDHGRSVFNTLECQTCHTPPLYTDLESHNVGTGDPAKEKNSHGREGKFDTPSLRGIWLTAPYFHDGSAATLQQVFQTGTTHNVFDTIDNSNLKALIDFILALPDDTDNPG